MIPSLQSFALLPRLTGVWRGDFICLDADARETKRYACLLTQRIIGDRWVQTNENSYADGTADTWRFLGAATAPGEMRLESPDAPYRDFRMLVREAGENVLLLHVWDAASGAALATETFTLLAPDLRVRTIQQFAAGTPHGFMAVKEHRIA